MKLGILAMTMLLTACKKESSNVYVSSCLPLEVYSKKQQMQVWQEAQITPEAGWVIFIADYKKLRDRAKAACSVE